MSVLSVLAPRREGACFFVLVSAVNKEGGLFSPPLGSKEGGFCPVLPVLPPLTEEVGGVNTSAPFPLLIFGMIGAEMGERDSNTGKGALGGGEGRVKNESFEL